MNFRPSLFWEKFKEATPGISSKMDIMLTPIWGMGFASVSGGAPPPKLCTGQGEGQHEGSGEKQEERQKKKAKDETHIKRCKAEEKRIQDKKEQSEGKWNKAKEKRKKYVKGTKRPKKEQKEWSKNRKGHGKEDWNSSTLK